MLREPVLHHDNFFQSNAELAQQGKVVWFRIYRYFWFFLNFCVTFSLFLHLTYIESEEWKKIIRYIDVQIFRNQKSESLKVLKSENLSWIVRAAALPQFTVHRSQITDHRSQITDHRPQITDHRSQFTDHRPQITVHSSQITDHRSQFTDHRSQITDHRSQTTDNSDAA